MHHLLSTSGCGRATAYSEENKIVSIGDRTHVAWLDSEQSGMSARVRTLYRDSGQWSPPTTIGEAFDNHGGPSLVDDSEGYLHVAYYPHHHPVRYRRSLRPNDASAWQEAEQVGTGLTYPKLTCGADDTLYMTARHSSLTAERKIGDGLWQLELWRRPSGGEWQGPQLLARARYPGYTHFGESVAWGPDGQTMHLAIRFHEKSDGGAYGRVQTVGYLVSPDCGHSWQRSDGTPVQLPVTADTVEVLATGGVDAGSMLEAGAIAVDAAGSPHLVYTVWDIEGGHGTTELATPAGAGSWRRVDLCAQLPPPLGGRSMGLASGIVFTGTRMVGVSTVEQVPAGTLPWGHPHSEVVRFTSDDGGRSFSFEQVSDTDPTTAHWFPNIQRPAGATAPGADGPGPSLIYQAGPAGDALSDVLSNHVHWVE